jgi:RNA polymerase sigma-70 factor (ECF subfamily)
VVIRVPDQRTSAGGYAALEDRLLVLDFQAGNPQAFVEIHRRYGSLVRHVCQRFLPNQQDVDEAFQETMIRAFQGLYRFNGRYALQPWIARIAKNVSLDILRGRARRPQIDGSAPATDELPQPSDEADQIVERLVQRDTVLAVLSDLPETHRRALMLREVEGRSHREVAQELEISTGQAKALIHRAKGSFRRRWLEKVANQGGFIGIAFLPLLWLARLAGGLRRVGDRLGHSAQAAQAAAPDAVTSTVSATAAPVVSTGVGDRLVAAGMTLLLAGGVTVGAAKIVDRTNNDGVERTVAESVAETLNVSAGRVEPPVDDPLTDRLATDKHRRIEAEPPLLIKPVPTPTVEPSPTVETTPVPAVSPPPPSVAPPPPAPEWAMSFVSDILGETTTLSRGASKVEGAAGKNLLFSQTVTGALDGPGDASTQIYVEYWGSAEGSRGTADFWLFLDTPEGRFEYRASANLTAIVMEEEGAAVYAFTGSYVLTSAPEAAVTGMPHDGSLSLDLSFWSDGTSLYESRLELLDSSG